MGSEKGCSRPSAARFRAAQFRAARFSGGGAETCGAELSNATDEKVRKDVHLILHFFLLVRS